jgi:hypothetical protein
MILPLNQEYFMVDRINGIQLDIHEEGLRVRKLDAGKLTRGQFWDVQDLRFRHHIREHIDSKPEAERVRDVPQVGAFVAQMDLKVMRDLNVLVGQGRRRQHQRYERQTLVLVTDRDDELRAGFMCEDNVRSRLLQDIKETGRQPSNIEKARGAAEMIGKLYVPHPRLIEGRHFVAEEFFHDGKLPGIELVTAGVAVEDYRDDQPAAGWPFREETAFRNTLRLMGLKPHPAEVEEVEAFGIGSRKAELEHWTAERLDDVRANIHGIPGVSFAIEQAFETI